MLMGKGKAVLTGIVTMILLAGCGSVQPVALPANPAVSNKAAEGGQSGRTFTGKIVGVDEVAIYAKAAGRVATVNKDAGDEVKAGEPLLTLESVELKAVLDMAKADLASARAKLEEAKKGTRKEDLVYAQAGWQQAAQKYQDVKNGKRPEEIAQLQASLQSAQTTYDAAAAKKDRMQSLFQQGAISKQSLEDAQQAYAQAKAQYERSQEDMALAKQGATQQTLAALESNVEQMKAIYDKAKNGATPEQIAQYEAAVQKAQAAVENAEYQLKNTTVTSPVNGYVSVKNINAGEMLGTGTPAMTVVNVQKVYVVIGVSEADLGKFSVNKEVEVAIDSVQKHVVGKVARISPKADAGTDTFTVKVLVDNPDGSLRSGMTGMVDVKE